MNSSKKQSLFAQNVQASEKEKKNASKRPPEQLNFIRGDPEALEMMAGECRST